MSDEQQSLIPVSEYKKNYVRNKNAKSEKKEEKLQVQVCNYIRRQYPEVIFMCDLASGLRLSIWLGSLHKKMRSSRGLPDLFIAKSSYSGTDRTLVHLNYGLFIELKAEGTRRKDGTIPPAWRKEKVGGIEVKYDHHAEQEAILVKLRRLDYKAEFAVGFDEAKKLIDEYLK